MADLTVTISNGPRTNAVGRRVPLAGDPVAALAQALEASPRTVDAWWGIHCWQGDHRETERWEDSAGVAVDIDFSDEAGEHVAPPPAEAQRLASAGLPGNLFHQTPRGARLVFVFPVPCTDAGAWDLAARGAGELVTQVLQRARLNAARNVGLAGFKVDAGALCDRARFLFTPRARVDDLQREATVVVLRSAPYSVEELAASAPKPDKVPAPPRPRSAAASARFEEASERFNADQASEWPRSGGTCPACGHHGCFGTLPDSPGRWSCFSAGHPDTCGIRAPSGSCFLGDALDLAAFAAARTPADHLRAEGYLTASASPEPRSRVPGEDDGDPDPRDPDPDPRDPVPAVPDPRGYVTPDRRTVAQVLAQVPTNALGRLWRPLAKQDLDWLTSVPPPRLYLLTGTVDGKEAGILALGKVGMLVAPGSAGKS
ncbi:MAG: hypothetical protein HY901_18270, partial [Deltaproteobacteria bacterium]|nr:hypothetical protein [Deltaproteobacteria bacterium]